MAATKTIDMFLNFKKDTPVGVIGKLRSFTVNSENNAVYKVLCSEHHNARGVPVIDFYKSSERIKKYMIEDDTYYLRYCNTIIDYNNYFTNWLNTIANWIIQINGHHIGTLYEDDTEKMYLICIEKNKVVYKQCSIEI